MSDFDWMVGRTVDGSVVFRAEADSGSWCKLVMTSDIARAIGERLLMECNADDCVAFREEP